MRPLAYGHESIGLQLLLYAFAGVVFLWPFELPIAIVAHGLLHDTIGAGYIVALHATLLTTTALLVLISSCWRLEGQAQDWGWIGLAALCYALIGFLPLITSATQPVETRFAYQQLLCGYLAPLTSIVAIAGLDEEWRERLWVAFYSGWVAFLVLSLLPLALSWNSAVQATQQFAQAPLPEKLLVWRYTLGEPWNIYGLYMGNANKISNYLIMFLLFSVFLLGRSSSPRMARHHVIIGAFWSLSCVTLVVMFSRAALFLLPVVFLASGIWNQLGKVSRYALVGVLLTGAAGTLTLAPAVIDYLLTARLFEASDASPLGTFAYRFEQWSELGKHFADYPLDALVGLGTTGYGVRFVGSEVAGTHNLLLDLWAESGVLSPILMLLVLALICVSALLSGRGGKHRLLVLVAVGVISALMTREHSPSYLFVTSLGGFCLAIIMYVAVVDDGRRPVPEVSS